MGTLANKLLLCITGLCALNPMSVFAKSPPQHKAENRRAALELRPSPAALVAAEMATSASFSSSWRREVVGSHAQSELPALGTEGGRTRVPSRAEEFARRVHREGLPVARLWENNSALVSLSLNNKCKPGLWVIQKMR
jgi:hypothetical protein